MENEFKVYIFKDHMLSRTTSLVLMEMSPEGNARCIHSPNDQGIPTASTLQGDNFIPLLNMTDTDFQKFANAFAKAIKDQGLPVKTADYNQAKLEQLSESSEKHIKNLNEIIDKLID